MNGTSPKELELRLTSLEKRFMRQNQQLRTLKSCFEAAQKSVDSRLNAVDQLITILTSNSSAENTLAAAGQGSNRLVTKGMSRPQAGPFAVGVVY